MTTRKGPDRVAILNADGTFDDPKVYEKLGEHFGELSEETIQDVEDLKTLTEEGRLSEPSLNATYVTPTPSTHTLPAGLGFLALGLAPTLTQLGNVVVGSAGITPEALFDSYSTARSAPGATYYVSTAGSDSNNGLTVGTAFRSIGKAINTANTGGVPALVYVAAGEYARANAFDATAGYQPAVDMAFIVPDGGRATAGTWDAATGFSADGTYTNTYSKAVSNATRVLNRLETDRFGNMIELTPVTSATRCNGTPGTWYCDGTKLYVNRVDGAAVSDTNTRYFRDAPNLRVSTQVSVYIKGFDIQGGGSSYSVFHVNSNAVTPAVTDALVAVNCSFKYGGAAGATNGAGFKSVNWYGIMAAFNCQSDANANDAYGIHNLQNDVAYLLTVNCKGRNNGRNVQSVNGFTLHQTCVGIDIAGEYDTNRGGTIHNIGSSKCYLLGTSVTNDLGDSAAGGGIPAVAVRAADTAEIWAERVRVDMPADRYAYQAIDGGAKIHRRNCVPVPQPDHGQGTIDTY